MDKQTQRRGQGTLGWIVRFAGRRKGSYIASVILAILNVVCGLSLSSIWHTSPKDCWKKQRISVIA